ncbi:alkaline phosphatase D family protein [Maribacter sp. 2308TA10-17]|uniref:alkaline phosphatase D family protein n=1 Tax=Maribacter sp. 2308TA10-17 TaxID=3386276 RepID=UPI0039BC8D71
MKIAFTSCVRYKAFNKQPEWKHILEYDPDYLFLLGDNIYMDFGCKWFSSDYNESPKHLSVTDFEKRMRSRYDDQFGEENFKQLVEHMRSKNGFYATWDDHDFAWNDAWGNDVREEKLSITTSLFHEKLNCSTNLPKVYYHVDTPLARVIFLDNRSYAKKGKDENRNVLLGEEQFAFLEEKLNHNLQYTIVCGGLTLNATPLGLGDDWRKFPNDLKKLCSLLSQKDRVVFLAGDIHQNKFIEPKYSSKLKCTTPFQLISSGMAINSLGIGHGIDEKHNWATLELATDKANIQFFKSHRLQPKKSQKATKVFNDHFAYL